MNLNSRTDLLASSVSLGLFSAASGVHCDVGFYRWVYPLRVVVRHQSVPSAGYGVAR